MGTTPRGGHHRISARLRKDLDRIDYGAVARRRCSEMIGAMAEPASSARARRQTVDLSEYPDLVVIYLGLRARSPRGILTLFRFGPRIRRSVAARPDGLLRHEMLAWGVIPPHFGMRQYWRDFDALERWARDEPHAAWWRALLSDMAGTGFWHEAYFARGGMESIYLDMPATGFASFAPVLDARHSMFSARRRMRMADGQSGPPPVSEQQLYGGELYG